MASSNNARGRGRKRIAMEKMKNESNLQVTFSKRKKGAFKKAFELSIYTGVQVGIIIFSPGGKVYSFGHPTVETVTDRFLSGISEPLSEEQLRNQTPLNATVAEAIANINTARDQILFEKSRRDALDAMLREREIQPLTSDNIQEQSLEQLQDLLEKIQNLSVGVERKLNSQVPQGLQNHGIAASSPPPGFQRSSYASAKQRLTGGSSLFGGGSSSGPFGARPNTFLGGGGRSYAAGPSTFIRGGSGGQFIAGPSTFLGGGGGNGGTLSIGGSGSGSGSGGFRSNAALGPSSFLGGPHIGGPSSFIGGGMNGVPFNIGPISIGSSSGGWKSELHPALAGGGWPSSLGGGSSGGGAHIFGHSTLIGGLSYNIGQSSVGGSGGLWQNVQPSSFGGGGQYIFGPNSFIGGGNSGFPFTVGQRSTGSGRGGWQDFHSSLIGGGPTTEGASTSRGRNDDNGANARFLEWGGSTPPSGSGHGN